MNTSIKLYDYHLPKSLIAETPSEQRDQSKLLIYNKERNTSTHTVFSDLFKHLCSGDMLILNDTKVIPGRIYLKKESGGIVEILFHKKVNEKTITCIYSSSRKLTLYSKLYLNESIFFTIEKIDRNYVILSCLNDPMNIFIKHGEVPLPKYIKRKATSNDITRYQTTYAKTPGSVAAPTAGLHFTKEILKQLKANGVLVEYITLHVTYNTFKPIENDDYTLHDIGSEYCFIKENLMNKIIKVKDNNKKIIAVGTTVTRALENYASKSLNGDYSGEVDLFITPGYKFKIIDSLITNFHLPQSTLLLLVASLTGRETLLNLYKNAIEHKYRFYSYGDSMFIRS